MSKIVIIGAGAAGLMAAYILSKNGYTVSVLEAQDRLGGRIHSFKDPRFSSLIELGAEFIHGDLPVTNDLMKEAGIKRAESSGSFWNVNKGKLSQGYGSTSDWVVLEKALNNVIEDITVQAFLDTYLDEYVELKQIVKGFVEGYDAADISRASVLAFRDEWMSDEAGDSRVDGGYGKLIEYLKEECNKNGCKIYISTITTEIEWSKGAVSILTDNGGSFAAEKIVITVPAGVLQAKLGKGCLKFIPEIREKTEYFKSIGFGNAMKVFLQFDEAFWQTDDFVKRFGGELNRLGFIVSDADIPVWWTQSPFNNAILTGWIGGPNTDKFVSMTEDEVIDIAIQSITYIFGSTKQLIQSLLRVGKVVNWANNCFERGGYTYTTVEGRGYKDTLDRPIEDTLYFAGEAFYFGPEMGTVEAAFASGKKIAEEIILKDS